MVEAKQDLGLSVLTSSAVFGAWSAWNSSLFTAATFVDTEEKLKHAKLAMDLGLATAIATGLGVYLVYGDKGKFAAASAIITGAVLYAAYYCKLESNPKLNGFMGGRSGKTITSWKPLTEKELKLLKVPNDFELVSEP